MATYQVIFTIDDNNPARDAASEQDILDAINASPLRGMAISWSIEKNIFPRRHFPRVQYGPQGPSIEAK